MIKLFGFRIRTKGEEEKATQRRAYNEKFLQEKAMHDFGKALIQKIDRIESQPNLRKKRRERSEKSRTEHDKWWERGWSAACARIKAMINKEA